MIEIETNPWNEILSHELSILKIWIIIENNKDLKIINKLFDYPIQLRMCIQIYLHYTRINYIRLYFNKNIWFYQNCRFFVFNNCLIESKFDSIWYFIKSYICPIYFANTLFDIKYLTIFILTNIIKNYARFFFSLFSTPKFHVARFISFPPGYSENFHTNRLDNCGKRNWNETTRIFRNGRSF